MPFKSRFRLVPSRAQLDQPITKFGGQPVWIAPPQWPLAPETGQPMLFLAQIALDEHLFPGGAGNVVYLFFSAAAEPIYSEAMTAVIQRGGKTMALTAPVVAFVQQATGPTLYERDADHQPIYREYEVLIESPVFEAPVPLAERYRLSDLDYNSGFQFAHRELAGNKLGGQPLYIEGLDNPPAAFSSDDWLLLMQLAPEQGYWGQHFQPNFYPFHMELGEFGILTIFISQNYTQAICYIQQP